MEIKTLLTIFFSILARSLSLSLARSHTLSHSPLRFRRGKFAFNCFLVLSLFALSFTLNLSLSLCLDLSFSFNRNNSFCFALGCFNAFSLFSESLSHFQAQFCLISFFFSNTLLDFLLIGFFYRLLFLTFLLFV